jgi:hypothetical protein
MSTFKALRGVAVAACLAMSLLLLMVGGAMAASPVYLCIQEKAGSPVTSGGTKGSCKPKEKSVALPSESAEQQTLLSILPHIKYVASGVGGKPTIQVSGVNVQVVNGAGKTATVNGEGNLVIGYDENLPGRCSNGGGEGPGLSDKEECEKGGGTWTPEPPHAQTGSHDLILGQEQTFTSYGGILAGFDNTLSGPFASVSGGSRNTASANDASVSGGFGNTASSNDASVSGGLENTASGNDASVSGGYANTANTEGASVSGGDQNLASGGYSSISGGLRSTAGGEISSISGGRENETTANNGASEGASISGGELNKVTGRNASVSGGYKNTASGDQSSVSGGTENTGGGEGEAFGNASSWIGGGYKNIAKGKFASIFGGKELTATSEYEAIP